jgi:hypothetical protein
VSVNTNDKFKKKKTKKTLSHKCFKVLHGASELLAFTSVFGKGKSDRLYIFLFIERICHSIQPEYAGSRVRLTDYYIAKM